jgi:hypothetical protein
MALGYTQPHIEWILEPLSHDQPGNHRMRQKVENACPQNLKDNTLPITTV